MVHTILLFVSDGPLVHPKDSSLSSGLISLVTGRKVSFQ